MESRAEAMNELCRVCAIRLQGNQRRWLFGQGGRASLQVVLSHVLGQTVTRDGRGEFLCGKCVHVLERLYRFDTVISRVEALSLEKLQRLLTEKDKLGQAVRQAYARHHQMSGHPAYQGQDITVDIVGLPHVQYNMLLNEDMALSEYESWSERNASCAHEGGCRNKSCYGCGAYRVPDSEYESVCQVPRRLRRLHPGTLFELSRDKSRSMPLDLLRLPSRSSSLGGGGSSYGGSIRSLRAGSLGGVSSASNLSLDTVLDSDGDPFEEPRSPRVMLEAAEQLRGIKYHAVSSPPDCKIPVRAGRGSAGSTPGSPCMKLEFGGAGEGQGNGVCMESPPPHRVDLCPDLLQELSDEYLSLSPQKSQALKQKHQKLQEALRQLKSQLQEARDEIHALKEAPSLGLTKHHGGTLPMYPDSPPPENGVDSAENQRHPPGAGGTCGVPHHESLIRRLTDGLHSKEELLQDCVSLLKCVKMADEPSPDVKGALIEKLRERLKDRDQALERAADVKFSALELKEKEAEQLRQALRDKDRDVARLADVLRKNEEMISALRDVLQQKEFGIPKLEALYKTLQQAAQERDELRIYALQEKDSMITSLQEALLSSNHDVEALADSLLGQGLDSSEKPSSVRLLVSQLQAKERLLLRAQDEKTQQSAAHQQEAQKLLSAVAGKDELLKEQLQHFDETLASKTQEAQDLRRRLAAKEEELNQHRSRESAASQERKSELNRLHSLMQEKDCAIMKFLQDSLEKDRIVGKLQERFQEGLRPGTGMKHTL